ncbi:MAG: MOSC domain-containing protein [Candidatus Pelagadaptatus aseana]|uniref:MOSC domain-containing protein n=1 Tax=Candidatus Pelagadaptatus aseana TaxID=3120508 RepID=UPI0039B187E9
MAELVGCIKQLWRYPVKSMVGETLDQAHIASYGMQADRGWILRDEDANELTIVRNTPKLLRCRSRYLEVPNGEDIPNVMITLPDGSEVSSNDPQVNQKISEVTGKNLSLWPLQPKRNWRHYRLSGINGAKAMKRQFASKELPDLSSFSWKLLSELSLFVTPLGRYYDCYPLHILTDNSLDTMKQIEPRGDFCVERFRPNIFIESHNKEVEFDEFRWVDGTLQIGEAVIKCESPTVRCSMPSQPQAGLEKDSKVVRSLDKHSGRNLGINASVIKAGDISVGDKVYWTPAKLNPLQKVAKPAVAKLKNTVLHTTLKTIDKISGR